MQPDFSKIKAFVLDVDGVLTDGTLYCFESGEQVRGFNIKDGFGIRQALTRGYQVAIITAKNEPSVRLRLEQLGITDIFMGAGDKLSVLKEYVNTALLSPETILYMGDDVPDIEAMQFAGLAVCPADAAADVAGIADYTCQLGGGKGAVREVIEMVLRAQENWIKQQG